MQLRQIELVQQSFNKVKPIADKAAELFYDRLFEIAPQVKPMFANSDIKEQGKKLMHTLSLAVQGLKDLETLIPFVQQLGVKHAGYGVTADQFQPVAEALLWTLEQGLGEDWNDDLKQAWIEAYTLLSTVMIEAMEQAEASVA